MKEQSSTSSQKIIMPDNELVGVKKSKDKSEEKESKQRSLFKDLKKEVDTGANGTQKYIIKKGENKGKVADINAIRNNNK